MTTTKRAATALTTEALLTSPKAFGLTTATPLQRAFCRVSDGLPLGALAERHEVVEAFGGVDAIAALAALPVGVAPIEMHLLAAIRGAKSLFAAAKIVQWSQTVDVSHLSAGDIVRIGVVTLKLDGPRAVMAHLAAHGREKPLLRALFDGEPTEDGATLLHPTGCPIDVTSLPLDRAGGSLQSTYLAGVAIDEEPRMVGASDGVKNWDHARDSILGRLLDGGGLIGIGSPHAPFGPVYNLTQQHFGHPSGDIVIARGSGPSLNPAWWTPERCARLQRTNATAYRTDCCADFADAEEALILSQDVEAITRSDPMSLTPQRDRVYIAAIDPATRRNAFALVVITPETRPDGSRFYREVLIRQWLSRGGEPLDPRDVFIAMRAHLAPYGITRLHSDQYSVDAMRSIAKACGLTIEEHTITPELKLDMFESLRTLISAHQVEINADQTQRADLLGIRKRVTQGGVSIHLPTTADGRHADYASGLALAVHVASQRTIQHVRAPAPIFFTPDAASFEGLSSPSTYTSPDTLPPQPTIRTGEQIEHDELKKYALANATPAEQARATTYPNVLYNGAPDPTEGF